MKSWYRHGPKICTWTDGIEYTHGIDSDSWYSIGTPESHTYKRAKGFPYTEFFVMN